jgi:Zn-finger nucleic acid-binding protein
MAHNRGVNPFAVTLSCPVCRTPLAKLSVGAGAGGGCQSCSGVWVDEVGLQAVREDLFAKILERSPPRAAPGRSITQLKCPVCEKPMLVTEVGGAVVDVCPGDGTWFDSGELETLAHAIAVARNRAALGRAESEPVPAAAVHRLSPEAQSQLDNLNDGLRRSIDRVEHLVAVQQAIRSHHYWHH